MNFIRRILGLGPKEPINTIKKPQAVKENRVEEKEKHFYDLDLILPVLVTEKTTAIELENQMTSIFHNRENVFNRIVIGLASFNYKNLDESNGGELFQVKPDDEELFLRFLVEHAEKNIQALDINFDYWNPVDMNLDFSILSAPITFFSSELIMSKKHMLSAHEKLNSKELFVSIPRRGLIFVCDKNLNEEDYKTFLNLHSYAVLKGDTDDELLCEDIFVVENAEIMSVLEMYQLSEILQAGI
ncbi:hypothetical protein [Tenacibaculum jejuense]|uniref:Uncharacterized protein n=1 Tax=Tenacibaculum jejuense TaxID=584609 RepID=A0A238UAN4_9FLAO|nr:hypothetical protein [Tenacibaculum jejuense]SNR16257.1 conserved protein of unknown function [Tenacibaculum jejuense]